MCDRTCQSFISVSMARSILRATLKGTYVVECKVHGPIDEKEANDKKYIWYLGKRSPVGKRP